MKTALTIAGSDSEAGAGIQADIKTMSAFGIYAMSAVTALTAQNTLGVSGVMEVPAAFLGEQLDSIFNDIVPDAVKIGMVCSASLIEMIAEKLKQYHAQHIVLDPILASTSGTSLLDPEAEHVLRERLFPLAEVLTPNVPECERLTGLAIHNREEMQIAAEYLHRQYGCAVICKGGHLEEACDDLLIYESGGDNQNINDSKNRSNQQNNRGQQANKCIRDKQQNKNICSNIKAVWFPGNRIDNPNTHGTGCTYSSAVACGLAESLALEESVQRAKEYMNGAISAQMELGRGSGPLNHFWRNTIWQQGLE